MKSNHFHWRIKQLIVKKEKKDRPRAPTDGRQRMGILRGHQVASKDSDQTAWICVGYFIWGEF